MRAKFQVRSVTKFPYSEEVNAVPVCDDGTPENEKFNKATPCGELKMSITNPTAMGFLQPGKEYYLDFTPVEKDGAQ